jgi:hypothetical protein
MSTAHHGDDRERISNALQRLFEQGQGKAKRAYPDWRMGADDEGELAFAVGTDTRHGTVVLNFNKPVTWMGMTPDDARKLAELLIEKADAMSATLPPKIGGGRHA